MDGFVLPPGLVRPPGEIPAYDAWLAALPQAVAGLADRWSLRLGPPFLPGGSSAWVAPAAAADGDPAVLKVGWVHDEAGTRRTACAPGTAAARCRWARTGTARRRPCLESCYQACRCPAPAGPEQDAVLAGCCAAVDHAPPGVFRPSRKCAPIGRERL